jgi:hypothetical protein
MQKFGVPIAERANLLQGSGRLNRILGLEEDLAAPRGEERETGEKAKERYCRSAVQAAVSGSSSCCRYNVWQFRHFALHFGPFPPFYS